MNIEDLEKIMVDYGVVIRAIPKVCRDIIEKRHINEYPDGKIVYLEDFKREMLIIKRIPKNAGKFLLEYNQKTSNMVKFEGKKYFDSITDAIQYLLEKERGQMKWKRLYLRSCF